MSTIELDQRIARAQLRIEQMRIYIAMLHPSQRAHEAMLLSSALLDLKELTQQRRDLQLDRQRVQNITAAA